MIKLPQMFIRTSTDFSGNCLAGIYIMFNFMKVKGKFISRLCYRTGSL